MFDWADFNSSVCLSIAGHRAAVRMELSKTETARILGVSDAVIAEYRAGTRLFHDSAQYCRRMTSLISLHRYLVASIGDARIMQIARWMRKFNDALDAVPAGLIQQADGCAKQLGYRVEGRAGAPAIAPKSGEETFDESTRRSDP